MANKNPGSAGKILLVDDVSDDPVMITQGSLAWTVIKRDGRYAVRLRDFEHPALASFPALPYFPIDPSWRIEATLERYERPQTVAAMTVIEGLEWNPESPGIAVFERDGETHTLEAYTSGDRLFFVFGDRTNGKESYPAGRFLYAAMPGEDGRLVLDFNRAYSPPCAFNDFATCPVASPRNLRTLEPLIRERVIDILESLPVGETFTASAAANAMPAQVWLFRTTRNAASARKKTIGASTCARSA